MIIMGKNNKGEVTTGAPEDLKSIAKGVNPFGGEYKKNPLFADEVDEEVFVSEGSNNISNNVYEVPFSAEFLKVWNNLSEESQKAILDLEIGKPYPEVLLYRDDNAVDANDKKLLQSVISNPLVIEELQKNMTKLDSDYSRGVIGNPSRQAGDILYNNLAVKQLEPKEFCQSWGVEEKDQEVFLSAWEKLNEDGQELFGMGVLDILIKGVPTHAQIDGGIGIEIGGGIVRYSEINENDRAEEGYVICNEDEPYTNPDVELNENEIAVLEKYTTEQWKKSQQSELKQDGGDPENSGPGL